MTTTGTTRTFSDMYSDLTNRIRAQTGTSGPIDVMKRYINISLQDIHIGAKEKMPWAERTAVLVTQPSYTTGTVSISQGSTTLTGSGTAWDTTNAFGAANARATGKLQLDGGLETYEIASVDSATQITLASKFTQSDLSAADYVYFEDEYDLASDFLRPSDPAFQFFDTGNTIHLADRNEFRTRFFNSRVPGKPKACSIIDRPPSGNVNPIRRVKFDRPTDQAYSIPYTYITSKLVVSSAGAAQEEFSADADEPLLPLPYRHIIVAKALYWAYRDRRDDRRSNEANQDFIDLWLRMVGDVQGGRSRPRMSVRLGPYASRARRPMSGYSPGVTAGTAFDELRD